MALLSLREPQRPSPKYGAKPEILVVEGKATEKLLLKTVSGPLVGQVLHLPSGGKGWVRGLSFYYTK